MSAHLPESVDAWRMVSARRSYAGSMAIAGLGRLTGLLASATGTVEYQLDFGRDELGSAYLAVRAKARVQLLCQRTLEPFGSTLAVQQHLGLIKDESEEAALPPGYEPLLVDGPLRLADVIEDELLLAVPLVPVAPGSEAALAPWQERSDAPEVEVPHPFAQLKTLKQD